MVLPATGDETAATGSSSSGRDFGEKRVDGVAVVLLGEEIHDGFSDNTADAVDADDLLPFGIARIALAFRHLRPLGRLSERFEGQEMARQALGVGLADMAYAERMQEAPERDLAA